MSARKPAAPILFPISDKKPPKRRPFLVVDIESKHDDTQLAGFTRPFLVGTYDPALREYKSFRDSPHLRDGRFWQSRHYSPGGCADRFMNHVLQDKYLGHDIYAHAGGTFDHLFWLRWLKVHRSEYDFKIIPLQSAIQALTVWKRIDEEVPMEKGAKVPTWTFLDSLRLFPTSLTKWCESFGLPGKEEQDLDAHEDDPSWEVYLKQDCIALSTCLTKLYDLVEHKLGGEIGMTAPSTAMKLFRRRYLGKGKSPKMLRRYQHFHDCPKINPETGAKCTGCLHAWIREGYYGGRTELFIDHGKNLHYYDLNSSYVAAMREPVPVEDLFVEDGGIDWRLYPKRGGFARCTVTIPDDCPYPPLPHRDEDTGKLLFPVGTFRGTWSLEELALLKDPLVKGKIEHVDRTVWWKKREIFTEMVDHLYRFRDKSLPGYDEGLSALSKLMGNSCYGKFGMREERTAIVFASSYEPGKCHLCRKECGEHDRGICSHCLGSKPATGEPDSEIWYQKTRVDASYVLPHIAAHITALARVRLWQGMKATHEAGGRVFYSDTDSLIIDVQLPSSTKLGEWKDEHPGKLITYAATGPKSYVIEIEGETPKVTLKGFPKDLRTKENFDFLRAGSKNKGARLVSGAP